MRSALAYLMLVVIVAIPAAAFAGTRTVEGNATGKYYNDVWNRWSKVPMAVYVDDAGSAYIMGTDGGIMKARGFLAPSDTKKVAALLRKSQEWVKTARAKKLEVTKKLGTFMRGSDFQRNGVALKFFAANEGKQTDVILSLVDFDNQFYKLDLYLDPGQVKQLIGLLDRVPATVAELKKQNAAAAKLR